LKKLLVSSFSGFFPFCFEWIFNTFFSWDLDSLEFFKKYFCFLKGKSACFQFLTHLFVLSLPLCQLTVHSVPDCIALWRRGGKNMDRDISFDIFLRWNLPSSVCDHSRRLGLEDHRHSIPIHGQNEFSFDSKDSAGLRFIHPISLSELGGKSALESKYSDGNNIWGKDILFGCI
jgi:hypothetical protein